MKTKFIFALLTSFILISCSTDTANAETTVNRFSTSNSSLAQREEELEAPFQDCYYKYLGKDTYAIFFEIPANYRYTVSESDGLYFIDLTAASTNNHAHDVTRMVKLTAINGVIDATFRVNGVIIKKPKVLINSH